MFECRGHLQIATPRASPAELEKKMTDELLDVDWQHPAHFS